MSGSDFTGKLRRAFGKMMNPYQDYQSDKPGVSENEFRRIIGQTEDEMGAEESRIIRERIRVAGRVQGVGFRYRARYAAKNYGVKGYVRNEYDGSVSMELQGTERQITDMLIELQNSPYIRMDSIDAQRIAVKEDERDFQVRY